MSLRTHFFYTGIAFFIGFAAGQAFQIIGHHSRGGRWCFITAEGDAGAFVALCRDLGV